MQRDRTADTVASAVTVLPATMKNFVPRLRDSGGINQWYNELSGRHRANTSCFECTVEPVCWEGEGGENRRISYTAGPRLCAKLAADEEGFVKCCFSIYMGFDHTKRELHGGSVSVEWTVNFQTVEKRYLLWYFIYLHFRN